MFDTQNAVKFIPTFRKRCLTKRGRQPPKYVVKSFCVALLIGGVSPGIAAAQTVTTYSYDALGRLVEASADSGDTEIFEHDDAGNITRAQRGAIQSSNQPPSCSGIGLHSTSSQFYSLSVLPNCTDPDGDTLSVASANVSTGNAFATVNNNIVYVSGIDAFEYVEVVVAVTDGFGNLIFDIHGIAGSGGGGLPPF